MKAKNYEKKSLITFLVIVLWIIEICFFSYLYNCKIIVYKKYQIVMINDKEGVVYLSKDDRKLWYKSSYFYYKNKKYSYEILEENESLELKELLIKTNIKKLKENDIITISIEEKRKNELKTILDIWGGDKNN